MSYSILKRKKRFRAAISSAFPHIPVFMDLGKKQCDNSVSIFTKKSSFNMNFSYRSENLSHFENLHIFKCLAYFHIKKLRKEI